MHCTPVCSCGRNSLRRGSACSGMASSPSGAYDNDNDNVVVLLGPDAIAMWMLRVSTSVLAPIEVMCTQARELEEIHNNNICDPGRVTQDLQSRVSSSRGPRDSSAVRKGDMYYMDVHDDRPGTQKAQCVRLGLGSLKPQVCKKTGWPPYKLIIPSVAWALKLSQPTPTRASGRPELNKLALAATSLVLVDSTRPHRKRKERLKATYEVLIVRNLSSLSELETAHLSLLGTK